MKPQIQSTCVIYIAYRLVTVFYRFKNQCLLSLFILGYLGAILWFLPNYFITDFTVWAALLLSPYIIRPNLAKIGNKKYLWLSLTFLLLAHYTGVQTFYFLAIGIAILYGIESIAGDTGYVPFFLLALISPTFKYFNNMLGFPVRLKLSELAGFILQSMGYEANVAGNVIVLNGTEFSVDPACVGLKMMAVSLLVGLLFMAYFQRQKEKSFSFLTITGVSLVLIGFNVASNLIRILILTIFTILPDNPNHDLVGVLCLVLYVIIPSYFLIQWVANKTKSFHITKIRWKRFEKPIYLNCILLTLIIITGFTKLNSQKPGNTFTPQFSTTEYSRKIINDDIIKLEKPGVLLYIKPMRRFYGAEHNPMICWVGSGYEFSRIKTQIIGSKEIFTGILKKGNDQLYSAWWFDNGKHQTISQTDWRWRAIKGENFWLVNMSSGNEKVLMTEISRLLKIGKNQQK